MKVCERCKEIHDGSYGTGRYCSKKCAFTKTEKQLLASKKPKSEETKKRMSKPKKDSSKMGKYDKFGANNPNSIEKNGYLKDRVGNQYENICISNKKNGLGWTEENKKNHSIVMLGNSNWMRNKKHSDETKNKISKTKLEQYKNGLVKLNHKNISDAEISISNFFIKNNIVFLHQYQIPGFGFIYDFFIPVYNLIIEYNGDYWHTNPDIYNENKIVDGRSAKEIWEKDKLKKEIAENNGYKFQTIWESEYNPGYKKNYNNNLLDKILYEYKNIVS